MTKTVLVLGGHDYGNPFKIEGWNVTYDKDDLMTGDVDLVCFTGGTDVDPKLYGDKRVFHTHAPDVKRDALETRLFNVARNQGVPMVGICRGAQLLCVMAGGTLIQHVQFHNQSHDMITSKGDQMVVSSSHHQMMDVRKMSLDSYKLLGWIENRSVNYEIGSGLTTPPPQDTEVVYFPKIKALAHQPHPEWMQPSSPYWKYFFETVDELMEDKL